MKFLNVVQEFWKIDCILPEQSICVVQKNNKHLKVKKKLFFEEVL
jgi:hypothetical protein